MGHFSAGQFVPRAFLQVNAVLIAEKEKEKIKRGRGLSLKVGPAVSDDAPRTWGQKPTLRNFIHLWCNCLFLFLMDGNSWMKRSYSAQSFQLDHRT